MARSNPVAAPWLLVRPDHALRRLKEVLAEGEQLKMNPPQTWNDGAWGEMESWIEATAAVLSAIFSDARFALAFRDRFVWTGHNAADEALRSIQRCMDLLVGVTRAVEAGDFARPTEFESDSSDVQVNRLVLQLNRFVDGLKYLRRPNAKGNDGTRNAYRLANEYDIQDALFLLIKTQFSDAVAESPTPKVGASYSLADVVIRSQRIAVEVKFGRVPADAKKFTKELKEDFADYLEAGMKTVIVLVIESVSDLGFEDLDNLEHTIPAPRIRIVRQRL